jgi:uncharacterized protein YggU (UPF0235/DUF167 family)
MTHATGDLFTVEPGAPAEGPWVIALTFQLRAGAGVTRFGGRAGNGLLVQIAAPASSPRANESVAALLATTLGIERGAVELVGGAGGREKHYRATVADLDDVRRRLDLAIDEAATINSGVGGRRSR